MSEDDLLRAVLDMARLLGVQSAHFRPARAVDKDGAERWITAVQGDGKGFPDLVLARNHAVLFAELKSDTGRLSPEQRRWAAVLPGWVIWRPCDLRSGLIQRELRVLGDPQVVRKLPATGHWDVSRHEPPAWLRADLRRRNG